MKPRYNSLAHRITDGMYLALTAPTLADFHETMDFVETLTHRVAAEELEICIAAAHEKAELSWATGIVYDA